jgi:hypothetical protein
MRRIHSTRLALAACLALATPAGAELYRYVDAEGREHWTEDPAKVPPDQRMSAPRPPGGTLSGGGAPAPRPRSSPMPDFEGSGALPRDVPAAPAPIEQIDGRGEADWRAEADYYERQVEAAERALELCEERDERVRLLQGLTDLDACAAKQSAIEGAESDLGRFEDLARRRGVPPGWLR